MTAFTVWLSLVFCSTRNPTGVLLFSVPAGEAQQSVSMLIHGGYKGSTVVGNATELSRIQIVAQRLGRWGVHGGIAELLELWRVVGGCTVADQSSCTLRIMF